MCVSIVRSLLTVASPALIVVLIDEVCILIFPFFALD
jgi:hypothetical protein